MIRAKIAIDKLKMKSKGEEMSTCNIKLNVVLRVLKTKRSYSNLSVIIIIGDCALWRKKEEERERNEHERVVYFVKLNALICEWNVLF